VQAGSLGKSVSTQNTNVKSVQKKGGTFTLSGEDPKGMLAFNRVGP